MTTAQDQVRCLLREDIAPILRAAGFRGTERSFAIPDPDWFAQIGFQTSTASTSTLSKLTINVQVIPKAVWNAERVERQYPAKPSPNTHYGRAGQFWQVRAGQLIDGDHHWWELDNRGTRRRQLAVELTDLIVDVVLPAMMSRMTSEPSPS
ncbi:DUF4304 domain-containing protein [Microbacterium sp. K24]|uniref:DUF4304 domain-containing protein n=1 Tax=Microbacterium sp. K24 TaxID=2305446 RepID=UPI00109D0E21|nr:DUF4304 domain-containing protein [Microbacterium sp. K24]